MRERQDELDQFNVRLLGVATREAYQAQKLTEDGFGVELFLDPDDQIRRLLGSAERFEWWRLFHPIGAKAYVQAVRQAKRFDPIWTEATQRPGLVLIDRDLNLRWSRVGARIGDYPSADEVIGAVRDALSS
ncbi:MAG: AhpC/TSA family protein [Acidimicrobiia bacterium]|nr:AhpC/TSA family protein [Acidimicrobiia bacterium]